MVFGKKRSFGQYVSDKIDEVSYRVGNFAHDKFDGLIEKIEFKVMGLQDRILKKVISGLFFLVSAVFIALGCFYFLKEFVGLTNTSSFLIIGVILMVVGLFIRPTERRSNYG